MNPITSTNRARRWLYLGIAMVALVGLVAGSVATGAFQTDRSGPSAAAAPSGAQATNFAKGLSQAFRQAAEQALPSVVLIEGRPVVRDRGTGNVQPKEGDDGEDSPFGELFRQHPELRHMFPDTPRGFSRIPTPHRDMLSAGSGVIIDASGVILTNNHVVQGDGKLVVRLTDGREFEVTDVKADPKSDLAIIRIKGAKNLKAAKLGDSDKLAVGDWVLALGNPFGLEGSVTAGIISAKARGVGQRGDYLQTDAAINPGNSGGPLVDLDGNVVGINTAIASNNGGFMGVGFAVPITTAKWVSEQLVKTGHVERARLGVGIQTITQDLADQIGADVRGGVVVTDVFPDSPGARAGMQSGDVIVKYNGQPIHDPQGLVGLVERGKIGQKESVEILRDGKHLTLAVTLDKQPADYGIASRGPSRSYSVPKPESSHFDKLGIEVGSLTRPVAERLGLKSTDGLVITDVHDGSMADVAGLKTGMVIVQANHKPVKTADDLRKALESQPLEKGALLLVRTPEGTHFVVVRPEKE